MLLNELAPHQVIQFSNALLMASQQMKARVAPRLNADFNFTEGANGAPYAVEIGGTVEMSELLTDDEKTDLLDVEKRRRLGDFIGRKLTLKIGDFERVEQLVDPENQKVREMAAAMARQEDRDGLSYIFDPVVETVKNAQTDKGITQTIPLPESQKIPFDFAGFHRNEAEGEDAPTGPGLGLTVNKLSEAKIRLDKGNYHEFMNDGMPCCFVEEEDLQFLQTSERIYNRESAYHTDMAIQKIGETGEVNYNGIKFIKINSGLLPRAQAQNPNTYWVPVFYPSAIHYRKIPLIYGGDGFTMPKIDFRPDRSNIRQAMLKYYQSGLRTHDEAVVLIEVQRRA